MATTLTQKEINSHVFEQQVKLPEPVPALLDYKKLRKTITAGILRAWLWIMLVFAVIGFLMGIDNRQELQQAMGFLGALAIGIMLIVVSVMETKGK